MTWRNPYPRRIVVNPSNPTHGEAAVYYADRFWHGVCPIPPQPALRIRAGAREACRRLRQERDAAVAQRDEERAGRQIEGDYLTGMEARLLPHRDTARADLAATWRAFDELTRGRRLEMSIDEVVDMYRREEER